MVLVLIFSVILPSYLDLSCKVSGHQPAALLFWVAVFWGVSRKFTKI